MRFQINIGLEIPGVKQTAKQRKQQALRALSLLEQHFAFVRSSIKQSPSEQTLVASFQAANKGIYQRALAISEALQQDCVAIYCPDTKTGALIGTRAAQWGEFNPNRFIAAD